VQTELLFAVIGNPVKHSLSPAMMNAAFKALGIPAVYLAFEVDELEGSLEVFHRMGFRGLSVTIPHKEAAHRLAGEVDETAEAIGAVNTLRRKGEYWEGCNTDCPGAIRALKAATSLRDKRTVVIGAGGAAKAVVYGLKREGAVVTVANRTVSRGEMLADAFESGFVPLSELGRHRFDIAVQCTSVGLGGTNPGSSPAPESFFHPGMVVLDIVYSPVWTPFLHFAKKAGCEVVSGLDMMLYQGAAQLEWWLERPAPLSVMSKALGIGHFAAVDS
jgi:shikimate dehydrogenase